MSNDERISLAAVVLLAALTVAIFMLTSEIRTTRERAQPLLDSGFARAIAST